MLSPSKICTNCAPIIFEYYQKGLATQTELLRMRDELQRLSFTKELGTLKDLSDAERSVSPKAKYQNSRISGKRPYGLNLAQKDSSRLDKQASLTTTATIVRSSTPSGKFSTKTVKDCHSQQNRYRDPLTSVNTILQPTLDSVSPLERLRDFENQVNKKVDSFKQRLREEVARSAKRPSYNRTIPSRPKTSAKALRFLEDDESKMNPKVSMFSPEPDDVKKNVRASPIQFNLTPRYDAKENIEKGSGPSKGEWTVGTNKEYRATTNTDRGLIHSNAKRELDSSIKKIKMNFKKELDMMKVRDKEISSPGPHDKKLNSPFFSPLRASELMSPNGHHHHHHFAKTEELKSNYSQFIKPSSNPLLDSLMFSPRENEGRLTDRTNQKHSPAWKDKSSEKKISIKDNYFVDMMSHPTKESPQKDFMKRDKDFFKNSNMKNIGVQDELQASHGTTKFLHSQSFNKYGNLLYQK